MADFDAFFSRMNPIFRALLRSPLHWLFSSALLLVTVTGRRTGRRYTIPVGYQRDGDRIVILVSQAQRKQWWRNYRETAPVELLLKGRAVAGRAIALTADDAGFREACESTLRRMPSIGRAFDIRFDPAVGLTSEQLESLRANAAVVVVELETLCERER